MCKHNFDNNQTCSHWICEITWKLCCWPWHQCDPISWASCQISKISSCACAGNAGIVFPTTVGKRPRHASWHVRDARAVMHAGIAKWRFPLKSVAGKSFPAFPTHAQSAFLRIWQEAHWNGASDWDGMCHALALIKHTRLLDAGHWSLNQALLLWRNNGRDSVSDHQPHDCLLNRLFRHRSEKTSKLHVTGLCVGNSPETGEFPALMACNAEKVFIWWRHYALLKKELMSFPAKMWIVAWLCGFGWEWY